MCAIRNTGTVLTVVLRWTEGLKTQTKKCNRCGDY